ncbi:MAG: hypothetical protein ABJO09_14185 [Hyphomicrobiales bacterium]
MSDVQIDNESVKVAASLAPADAEQEKESSSPSGELVVYRATKPEEIVNIRGIAHEFHAESRYAHLQFSEEKLTRAFSRAINNPSNTLSIYIQCDGETVGIVQAAAGDYYLGIGGRIVSVLNLYVSRRIRGTYLGGKVGVKLLRVVSEWAGTQRAEEIHIHSTSGIDPLRTDKLLTRMGFEVIGGNYMARLG